MSDTLKNFMQENPQFSYEFFMRRNRHPFVSGLYINGFVKDLPMVNKGEEEIMYGLNKLRNSCSSGVTSRQGEVR